MLGGVILHAGEHVLAGRAGRLAHQKVAVVFEQVLALGAADVAVVPRLGQQLRFLDLRRDCKWFCGFSLKKNIRLVYHDS